MHILFFESSCGFRGTTRSIFAYAKSLLLLNENYTITYGFFSNHPFNCLSGARRFLDLGIQVVPVSSMSALSTVKPDIVYFITGDNSLEIPLQFSGFCNNILLHQVGFTRPFDLPSHIHMIYVSPWQNIYFNSALPVLPHLTLPSSILSTANARESFGIPPSSCLGRHKVLILGIYPL